MARRTGVGAGRIWIFDLAALLLFAITLPWMVAGFCNAVIGFVIMRISPMPWRP